MTIGGSVGLLHLRKGASHPSAHGCACGLSIHDAQRFPLRRMSQKGEAPKASFQGDSFSVPYSQCKTLFEAILGQGSHTKCTHD